MTDSAERPSPRASPREPGAPLLGPPRPAPRHRPGAPPPCLDRTTAEHPIAGRDARHLADCRGRGRQVPRNRDTTTADDLLLARWPAGGRDRWHAAPPQHVPLLVPDG